MITGAPPRFAHGLVIGKFYPLHAGHAHLIRTAQGRCDAVTVLALASSVESIPLEVRAAWIAEDHPGVTLVTAVDDTPIDYESPAAWDAHVATIADALPGPVDAVFTSDGYGAELARRLAATWVEVDPARTTYPISGRAIRADPAAGWWALSSSVRSSLARRVVVVGAESTGTTTLAAALAEELDTLWVPEYGREYTEVRAGGPSARWRADEFTLIVDRQLAAEERAARRAPRPVIICDTDVLATAIWHERYVGHRPEAIWARAAAHRPALYVLTGDEIPFVPDGMRDGEAIRGPMHRQFRAELARQPVPWLEVSGSVDARVAAALPAIEQAVAAGLRFADPLESATY